MKYLQKKKFKEWIQRHEPYQTVGWSGSQQRCPLAMYARLLQPQQDEFYSTDARVSAVRIILPDLSEIATPVWTKKFIQRVDQLQAGTPISAREALDFIG